MTQIELTKKIPITEEEVTKILQDTKEYRALDLIKKILLKDVVSKEEILELAQFYGYRLRTERRISKSKLNAETQIVLENCKTMSKKKIPITTGSYIKFSGKTEKDKDSVSKRLRALKEKNYLRRLSQKRVKRKMTTTYGVV